MDLVGHHHHIDVFAPQQLRAQLTEHVSVELGSERIRVALRIVPDDNNPCAILAMQDESVRSRHTLRAAPFHEKCGRLVFRFVNPFKQERVLH
ncbi:hypothetical protein [Variovorax sp. dw_308]|uniref:hypothetical protein n=1 Tax=Variovorax sp. dw_308 TaxID=2721546 RepID=UPI001C4797D7|nr:hypothetical protein [Variovorax sp. dw_308]